MNISAYPEQGADAPRSPVALVGAGPGHPGLLTVRAVELLKRADLVLYDRLVPVRLLDAVPAGAQRICVDSLHGSHPERWPEIYQLMIDAARQGLIEFRALFPQLNSVAMVINAERNIPHSHPLLIDAREKVHDGLMLAGLATGERPGLR